MKLSELIAALAQEITEEGDKELSENFMIYYEHGRIGYC
jgi:hypothetical protein